MTWTTLPAVTDTETRRVTDWVRRHQAGLWRHLRWLGCPADLAAEVMQDALLAALDAGIHEDRDGRVAARWLRSAARNLFRSALRQKGRRPESALLPEVEAEAAWRKHAGGGDGGGYVAALRVCLGQLQERQRRALELRYVEGASREAMAAELDIGAEGIKTLLRRLRDGLRQCVADRIEAEASDAE